MPEVSVILPVYRADKYIEECVNSILNQSIRDFELIIVVNGTDEATLSKITRFRDSRIVKYNLGEPDLVEAINLAISNSKGRYLARIDADDQMPPDRLKFQKKFLDQNPDFDVVSGKVDFVGDRKKAYGYYLHVKWLNQLNNQEDIFLNRFVDSPVANPSLMMRKKLFEKYGLYKKGDFPEDYEMVLRWLDEGVKIGKVNGKVLLWRDHSERLTRNHAAYNQEAFYRIKTEYLVKWFDRSQSAQNGVLIWGTGKSVYEKSKFLYEHGVKIHGYIDVKKTAASYKNVPVFHYESFPENLFILSYVSDRRGRAKIYEYLTRHDYKQGENFYMMS